MTIQPDPQYKLRLPEELRDKVKESANNFNRSMNADIVARLEKSFTSDNDKLTDIERSHYEALKEDIKFMSEDLKALIKQVTEYQNSKY